MIKRKFEVSGRRTDYPLQQHNTLAVESYADEFIPINDVADLEAAARQYRNRRCLILGGGSNLLLDEPRIKAPVLWMNMRGIEVTQTSADDVMVNVMAGENWHDFVLWCVQRDYGGIENLALIPGSAGAAPVQNIGAYGVEISDTLRQVTAFNWRDASLRHFDAAACAFGYRDSSFRRPANEWVIVSVSLRLRRRRHQLHLDYGGIRDWLAAAGVTQPHIKDVSDAVIDIRRQRLPDPRQLPNAGSFFKNPLVSRDAYQRIRRDNPDVPGFAVADGRIKIPAGWLIEQCGWKGRQARACAVHKQHALVLINQGGTGADILALAEQIRTDVQARFGLSLELEVSLASHLV